MPTAKSRSIWSRPPAMAEDEAEAERRRPMLPRATLRCAEREVVAAPGGQASARQLQPRFARCCKTRRRRSSLRVTASQSGDCFQSSCQNGDRPQLKEHCDYALIGVCPRFGMSIPYLPASAADVVITPTEMGVDDGS